MVFKTKWYTEGGSGMWSHAPSTSTLAMVKTIWLYLIVYSHNITYNSQETSPLLSRCCPLF